MVKTKTPTFKNYIQWMWYLFFAAILSLGLLFFGAVFEWYGPMPDLQELENPKTNLATQIISSDGEILGKYYLDDNRTPITYEELPQNMVQALIATEDERFYEHAGIDWKGTLRAFTYLGKRGGASTITQQLARQIFVGVRSRNTISDTKQTVFVQLQKFFLIKLLLH